MMKMIYLIAVVAAFAALSIKVTPHTNAVSTMTSERATDGAFRDGMYLGTLAAERGEAPHVAFGRWATAADRQSFTEGYEESYQETAARIVRSQPTANNGTPFRHGIYMARLDAEREREPHLGTGRRSRVQDQTSFVAGYSQTFDEFAKALNTRADRPSQASLVK